MAGVDALAQLIEFADPGRQSHGIRASCTDRSRNAQTPFARRLIDEPSPSNSTALVNLAGRAYGRPLAPAESQDIRGTLPASCGAEEIPHDEAFRLTLARLLVAHPPFFTAFEQPTVRAPGKVRFPIGSWPAGRAISSGRRSPTRN